MENKNNNNNNSSNSLVFGRWPQTTTTTTTQVIPWSLADGRRQKREIFFAHQLLTLVFLLGLMYSHVLAG